jgi:hypothetical protein
MRRQRQQWREDAATLNPCRDILFGITLTMASSGAKTLKLGESLDKDDDGRQGFCWWRTRSSMACMLFVASLGEGNLLGVRG